jgi:predicted ATPase
MIKQIHIKGYRSLADVNVELRPLNVLIGENGTGKSNFLDCFGLLAEAAGGHLSSAVRDREGMSSMLWAGGANSIQFDVAMEISGASSRYHCEIGEVRETHRVTHEELTYQPKDQPPKTLLSVRDGHGEASWGDWRVRLRPAGTPPNFPELFAESLRQTKAAPAQEVVDVDLGELALAQLASRDRFGLFLPVLILVLSKVYRPVDATPGATIRQPEYLADDVVPEAGAGNLASVLFNLQTRGDYRTNFEEIVRTLETAYSEFDGINVQVQPGERGKVAVRWREKPFEKREFRPSELSDGTLRFLWLATLLLSPRVPLLKCLDTPEHDMHPKMLAIIADLLKAASERTQVIVATHSPLLVDHLDPEDVLITEKKDGATVLRRASDRADLRGWLEKFTLGELMATGELERSE